MLRFVPDTNVSLDLFVFGESSCASLLAAVQAGHVALVTREDCREEWRAVLSYPQLKLDEERRAQAIALFDAHVCCLQSSDVMALRPLPRCRDRDDQKFLELAQQAGAVALLTRDDALLQLARRTQREGLFSILLPALWQEAISHR